MLLVESIPTSDFLGLENGSPHTFRGEAAIKLAKSKDCNFVIPTVLFPHAPAVYEINHTELGERKTLFLPRPAPLALRCTNEELDINSQIANLNYVTGSLGYDIGGGIDVGKRKVAYDSRSGEIVRTIWNPRYRPIITSLQT